jgi:hypothetical protein
MREKKPSLLHRYLSRLLLPLGRSNRDYSTEQEIRPIYFTKDKTVTISRFRSVFSSDKKPIGVVTVEGGKAEFQSLSDNSKRVNLVQGSGDFGTRVYYYRDDVEHVFISVGNHFIRIPRCEIPMIRIGLRKFTQNAKPLLRPVGKPFNDYDPPPPTSSLMKNNP